MSGVNGYQRKYNPVGRAHAIAYLKALITSNLDGFPSRSSTLESNCIGKCPRCNSAHIAKRGRDKQNRQRYLCRECKRGFNAATGKPLSSTNLSLEVWLSFVECYIDARSVRFTAAICKISPNTALFMRHRLNLLIAASWEESRTASRCDRQTNAREHAAYQAVPIITIPSNRSKREQCHFSIGHNPPVGIDAASRLVAQELAAWSVFGASHETESWIEASYRDFIEPFRGISIKWEAGYRWWHFWILYRTLLALLDPFAKLLLKKLSMLTDGQHIVTYNLPLGAFAQAWVSRVEACGNN